MRVRGEKVCTIMISTFLCCIFGTINAQQKNISKKVASANISISKLNLSEKDKVETIEWITSKFNKYLKPSHLFTAIKNEEPFTDNTTLLTLTKIVAAILKLHLIKGIVHLSFRGIRFYI